MYLSFEILGTENPLIIDKIETVFSDITVLEIDSYDCKFTIDMSDFLTSENGYDSSKDKSNKNVVYAKALAALENIYFH